MSIAADSAGREMKQFLAGTREDVMRWLPRGELIGGTVRPAPAGMRLKLHKSNLHG
jgi:hypothetical protein